MSAADECFWVEGMIAEWQSRDAYLVERVVTVDAADRRSRGYDAEVRVDFLHLESWSRCPQDYRSYSLKPGDGDVVVREPTDDELVRIAKFRLLGEDADC